MKSGKLHIIILAVVLTVSLLCLTACQESTGSKYERANKLLTEGKYTEAAAIFDEISTYEDASKMSLYTKAINAAESGDYETAFSTFASLGEFKDCPMMMTYYKGRQDEVSVYDGASINESKWFDAIALYESIPLFRDSKDRAVSCRIAAYDQAIKSGDEGDTTFAISILQELGTYSDAAKQVKYYQAVALLNQGDYSGASGTFGLIPGFRDADSRVTSVLEDAYKTAAAKEEAGELDEANTIFLNLGEYKDSADRAYKLYYDAGTTRREAGDWNGARSAFTKAGSYSDAAEQIKETTYQEASALETVGDQEGAYKLFISLGEYKDSFERANKPFYEQGVAKRDNQEWDAARAAFEHAGTYSDAAEQILATYYAEGVARRTAGEWDEAANAFYFAGNYMDASEQIKATRYAEGEAKRVAGEWDGARKAFVYASDFLDAVEQIKETTYQEASALETVGDQEGAYKLFISLGEYKDSFERANKPFYEQGVAKRDNQEWDAARAAFEHAGTYSDVAEQILATYYAEGVARRTAGEWDEAANAFYFAGNYMDASVQIKATRYAEGEAKRVAGEWDGARKAFGYASDFLDAAEQIKETTYQEASALEAVGDQEGAYKLFINLGEYKDSFERANKPYYELGVVKRDNQEWDAARTAFEHAGTYSDAAEQIKETTYQEATNAYTAGEYEKAYIIYCRIKNYKDVDTLLVNDDNLVATSAAAREAKLEPYREAGNIVTFGSYPQTKEGTDWTPVEWIVLDYDETNQRALLLSKYGLDAVPYNKEPTYITWEQCTLRAWLNSEFLNKAFSADEQSAILVTNVDNSLGQGYSERSASGGMSTRDRIFLLSYAEAERFLGVTFEKNYNKKSRAAPTAYAIAQGAYKPGSNQTEDGEQAVWWWLRSPGLVQNRAANVSSDGSFNSNYVHNGSGVVRPAFWLDLESDFF